jgi:hypothetical protein
MVQPFDARRLALSGEVVPVAEKVGSFLDYGFFSASSNGVLVYKSGVGLDYQLTWFDRQGRVLAKVAEPGRYNSLALSPDGRRVAVSRTNPENTPNWDVWLLDVARNTSRDGRFGAGDRNRAVLNTRAGVTVPALAEA